MADFNLGDAVIRLTATAEGFNKTIGDVDRMIDRRVGNIQRKINGLSQGLNRMASGIVRGAAIVGTAAAVAGGTALKMASDFESAFAGVRKTVDASEEEFAQLRKNILDMAGEIPQSSEALAGIMEIAGQLGVRGVDNLTTFTRTIAMLGDTTNIAGEEGALGLTRFINVTGGAIEDVDRLGSVLVDLGNNFAARENEILDNATALASFAQQTGLTQQQTLALAATIAASGGQSEAASSAFQRLGFELKSTVLGALSGDKGAIAQLEKFAKVAGVSAEEFAEAFRKDPMEAITLFLEGLGRIQEEGGDAARALGEIFSPSSGKAPVRLARELFKVTANVGQLRSAIDTANEAWVENTALTEEARKRYETFGSSLLIMWNNVKTIIIEGVTPFLKPLVEALRDQVIPKLEELRDLVRDNADRIKAFASEAVGTAVERFKALVEWVKANKDEIGAWARAAFEALQKWGPLVAKVAAFIVVAAPVATIISGVVNGLVGLSKFASLAGTGVAKLAAALGVGTAGTALSLSIALAGIIALIESLTNDSGFDNYVTRFIDKWDLARKAIDRASDALVKYFDVWKEVYTLGFADTNTFNAGGGLGARSQQLLASGALPDAVRREHGGPVTAGRAVQLHPPEIFIPSQNGQIVSKADTERLIEAIRGGGGGKTINLTVNAPGDGREIGQAIIRTLKMQGA